MERNPLTLLLGGGCRSIPTSAVRLPPPEQERSMSYTRREVVVTDIRMPLWSIVIFMVKFTVASIPAVLIATIILYAFVGAFGAVIMGIVAGITGSWPSFQ